MRSCDSASRAYKTYLLPFLDRVARCDGRPAQMKITGYHTRAVVYVNHVAGKKKVIYQSHDPAIRGPHWCSHRPREIHAEMPARYCPVEHPSGTEAAGDG